MSVIKCTTERLIERALILKEEQRDLENRLKQVNDELQDIGAVVVGTGVAQIVKTSKGDVVVRASKELVADYKTLLMKQCKPATFNNLVRANGIEKTTYFITLRSRGEEEYTRARIAQMRARASNGKK